MNEKIFITNGKVLKESVEFDYLILTRKDKKGKHPHSSYDFNKEPHPDLIAAFKRLDVHVALQSFIIKKSLIDNISEPDPELIEPFHCTGFHVKGTPDDIEAYKLHGYMILPTGKTLALGCPLERNVDAAEQDLFEPGKSDSYLFIKDLREAVTQCQKELEEYKNGKYGTDTNGTTDKEDQPKATKKQSQKLVNEEAIIPLETGGKKRGRKANPEGYEVI